jgi:hypothetical protein
MSNKLSLTDFIEKSVKIHGSKYRYDESIYISAHEKIEIICPIHGNFFMRANDHMHGKGCDKCGQASKAIKTSKYKKKTTEQFIEQAKAIYGDKYNYDKVNYTGPGKEIIIVCPVHGDTIQMPHKHLKISGCPKCSNLIKGRPSKPEISWLDSLDISEENRQITLRVEGQRYLVDAYDPKTNIIYEFNGDFWHGNLNVFEPDKKHPKIGKTYKELHAKTLKRENILKDNGYTICSIWEDDWNHGDTPVYSVKIKFST